MRTEQLRRYRRFPAARWPNDYADVPLLGQFEMHLPFLLGYFRERQIEHPLNLHYSRRALNSDASQNVSARQVNPSSVNLSSSSIC